jgi:hypothetical protein
MSKTLIKDEGIWKEVLRPYVKDGGTWRPIKKIWVKVNGVWRQTFGSTGTLTFPVGSSSWVVPAGVYSITVTGSGGGGGGGSGDGGANNDGPGYGGGGSNLISQTYSVTPGQLINIFVGSGGSVGFGQRGGAGLPTMVAGTGVSFFAQGGGGGASWNGWGPPGQISPAYFNIITQESVAAVEDTVYRGGAGANGATSGARPTPGATTNGGANGGRGGNHDRQAGVAGQSGKLTIVF